MFIYFLWQLLLWGLSFQSLVAAVTLISYIALNLRFSYEFSELFKIKLTLTEQKLFALLFSS